MIVESCRLLALSLVLAAAGPACAETWYVNTQKGSDKAAGTQPQQAFKSLARGLRELKPGDTLKVASGIYYEQLAVTASGADGQPITIMGDGPTRPVIKNLEDAITISGSYVDLSFFEAHSMGEGTAIAIGKKNHHVRVANAIARDTGCGGIAAQQTDYLTIEDNVVRGNSQRSPWQCSGISIYQAKAFDDKPGFHNVIRRNVSYANMNLVVDNKVSQSNGKTTDGNGIIVDDFRNTQLNSANGVYKPATLVENNLVVDNGGRGVQVFLSDNVVVRNNTAYMNLKDKNLMGGAANGELSAVKSSAVTFVNNLVVARDKKLVAFLDSMTTGNRWDANVAVGTKSSQQSDARWGESNRFDVDPKLRAPALDAINADFHPQRDSALVQAGLADNAPGDDLDKQKRPAGKPTLGALEPKPE
jgi:parallel beta-helix repeat protein